MGRKKKKYEEVNGKTYWREITSGNHPVSAWITVNSPSSLLSAIWMLKRQMHNSIVSSNDNKNNNKQ